MDSPDLAYSTFFPKILNISEEQTLKNIWKKNRMITVHWRTGLPCLDGELDGFILLLW